MWQYTVHTNGKKKHNSPRNKKNAHRRRRQKPAVKQRTIIYFNYTLYSLWRPQTALIRNNNPPTVLCDGRRRPVLWKKKNLVRLVARTWLYNRLMCLFDWLIDRSWLLSSNAINQSFDAILNQFIPQRSALRFVGRKPSRTMSLIPLHEPPLHIM